MRPGCVAAEGGEQACFPLELPLLLLLLLLRLLSPAPLACSFSHRRSGRARMSRLSSHSKRTLSAPPALPSLFCPHRRSDMVGILVEGRNFDADTLAAAGWASLELKIRIPYLFLDRDDDG